MSTTRVSWIVNQRIGIPDPRCVKWWSVDVENSCSIFLSILWWLYLCQCRLLTPASAIHLATSYLPRIPTNDYEFQQMLFNRNFLDVYRHWFCVLPEFNRCKIPTCIMYYSVKRCCVWQYRSHELMCLEWINVSNVKCAESCVPSRTDWVRWH